MAAAWTAARGMVAGSHSGWGGGAATQHSSGQELLSTGGVALSQQDAAAAPRQQGWVYGPPEAAVAAPVAAVDAHSADNNDAPADAVIGGGGGAAVVLACFWHVIDDVVGEDRSTALHRATPALLSFYVVSFCQRLGTALLFGLFHHARSSMAQLIALLTLHCGFMVYMLALQPYTSLLLLIADITAYSCELVILGVAATLRSAPGSPALLTTLVACYFIDLFAMLAPELLRYGLAAAIWLRGRCAGRRHGGRSCSAARHPPPQLDEPQGTVTGLTAATGKRHCSTEDTISTGSGDGMVVVAGAGGIVGSGAKARHRNSSMRGPSAAS
jgi:hypothetical protein